MMERSWISEAIQFLDVLAFNPEDVQPRPIDLAPYNRGPAGSADDVAAGPQDSKLPKLLLPDAFSTTVGWRPTGVQTGQVKIFLARFPKDFNLFSMGKFVLPCFGGLPYVTKEGRLPCPALCTMSAIKMVARSNDFEGDDIERILQRRPTRFPNRSCRPQ